MRCVQVERSVADADGGAFGRRDPLDGGDAAPGRFDRALRFLRLFRLRWWALAPILVADALGILYGYYYYASPGEQFDLGHLACGPGAVQQYCQPVWLWPLVADSPNAVLVAVVAVLLFRLAGWRSKWLDAAALVLNVYVGLWTATLFLSYPDEMGTFQWGSTNSILFVTHLGMPLQGLTFAWDVRRDRWRWTEAAVLLLGCAAFVWVDYWGPRLHPAPFVASFAHDHVVGLPGDAWLAIVSPALMLGAVAVWLALARPGAAKAARDAERTPL